MVGKRGQSSAERRRTESPARPDERDARIDRLTDLVERFLERDIRREMEAPPHPPPPPFPPRVENVDYTEKFQKLKPPVFLGGVDPKIAENWLRTLERMFIHGRIPEIEKVTCAAFMLRDDASYWWDSMVSVHDAATMTWDQFRELFEAKYFTAAAHAAKKKEFINLKQGDMSVEEYIRKFEELSRYAPHLVCTEKLKIEHFMEGLRPEIYRDIELADIEGATYAK